MKRKKRKKKGKGWRSGEDEKGEGKAAGNRRGGHL